jgi:hypothetical protein
LKEFLLAEQFFSSVNCREHQLSHERDGAKWEKCYHFQRCYEQEKTPLPLTKTEHQRTGIYLRYRSVFDFEHKIRNKLNMFVFSKLLDRKTLDSDKTV